MADKDTIAPAAAAATDANALRDVPSDIGEYEKFVAEGGHDHNEKLLNRDKAIADAKAAGVLAETPQAETEAQEKKHRNGFQRRVSSLQRKIGERDERIRALEAQVNARPVQSNGAAPAAGEKRDAEPAPAPAQAKTNGKAEPPPRPVETDPKFKTYGEYVEALTDWKVERQLEKQAEQAAARDAHKADADKGKTITDAHNARVDEAKTRYPDWGTAFNGLDDHSFTEPMVVFIFESERGPDVTYYLATHRDELARIRSLSPLRQAAELGRIEARIETDAAGKTDAEEEEPEEPAPKPAEKRRPNGTKAPPPAKPIGGTSGKGSDEMPDPTNFEAYEAWSKRQAAKGITR
jgi:hypothetical protein